DQFLAHEAGHEDRCEKEHYHSTENDFFMPKGEILGKKEDRIMDLVRADLEKFPTTKVKVYKPRLFSFKAPLEVVVLGNDLEMIKQVSDELLEKIRGVDGITDLKSSMEEGYPEIQIIFNRALLASQNMTINSVGAQIRNKIEGEFLINVEFQPGTALKENTAIITDISEVIKKHKEIDSIYELIGKGSRGGISFQEERENLSEFTLRLKPGILGKKEDRIMDLVRADLEKFPTTKVKVYKPRLFSFKAPLEVVVLGNNLEMIKQVSDELLEKIRGVDGITDLKSSMEEGYPEIQIIFNRALLASQNMTINSAGAQIRNKIEGDVATRFIESDREVDIRVRLSEGFRDRVDKIG
ncbi:unnamed protein product, partial [marine sediment metagenome]